ncbi:hypothetical protein BsWGS_04711 [Bradybaena similaris]
MKVLLLSGLILLALATVEARIPCNAFTCDKAKCTVLTEDNCAGRIVLNGGVCHCCDGCYTVLEQGQDCGPSHFIGLPRFVVCGDGLQCDQDTRTCEVPAEV